MSRLYKRLRQKGLRKTTAFKMTGKAKISSKMKILKKIDPYGNFDKDNKINKYDCQPLNKKKQDNEYKEGQREEWIKKHPSLYQNIATDFEIEEYPYGTPIKTIKEEARRRYAHTIREHNKGMKKTNLNEGLKEGYTWAAKRPTKEENLPLTKKDLSERRFVYEHKKR